MAKPIKRTTTNYAKIKELKVSFSTMQSTMRI